MTAALEATLDRLWSRPPMLVMQPATSAARVSKGGREGQGKRRKREETEERGETRGQRKVEGGWRPSF